MTYNPFADSSPGYQRSDTRDIVRYPGLFLVHGTDQATNLRLCACGCRDTVNNGKRMFRQGHDQRLLGKLMRAHVAGAEVHIEADNEVKTASAAAVARYFDKLRGSHHWTDRLNDAKTRETTPASRRPARPAKVAAAKPDATATAPEPAPTQPTTAPEPRTIEEAFDRDWNARQQAAADAAAAQTRQAVAEFAQTREPQSEPTPAPDQAPTQGQVKVGRWHYPARRLADGTVERCAQRDGNGLYIAADDRTAATFQEG